MRFPFPAIGLFVAGLLPAQAQVPERLRPFVKEDARAIVLNHVRVIDGTGAAPAEDALIEIRNGRIASVRSASAGGSPPADGKVLDATGKTVIPGLVGMHEHIFYPLPDGGAGRLGLYGEMADSAPRLYLAAGVTTARTAGSMEPYADLSLKKLIDSGRAPGPKMHITGPYIGSLLPELVQMHTLAGPEDAARLVDYWAAEGATSFKAYMVITPEELKAAIDRAHAHKLKITGHLCSVGFTEAAAMGIDNLEHGLIVDSEFFPGKKPGVCPGQSVYLADMAKNLEVESPKVQTMIHDLVAHHVAVTSTLAVFEISVPNRPPLASLNRTRMALTDKAWAEFLAGRARASERTAPFDFGALFQKEMQFERDFVKAGGLLMAGCDPTGYGGVVPGFGDQRELELLVEAGFTPLEAIHIATENGANFLGEDEQIGTIAAGKAADMVLIDGNPAANISDVVKVNTVFKDGIGYDPEKLIDSVRGLMGLR
jgi:imidazolonepropionase-like amidohydrolase